MGIFLVGGIGRTTCEHSASWTSDLRVSSSGQVYRVMGLSIFTSGCVISIFGFWYLRVKWCLRLVRSTLGVEHQLFVYFEWIYLSGSTYSSNTLSTILG